VCVLLSCLLSCCLFWRLKQPQMLPTHQPPARPQPMAQPTLVMTVVCMASISTLLCIQTKPTTVFCKVRTWADGRAAGSGRNSAAISCRSCTDTFKRSRAASSGTERGSDSPPMHSYRVAPAVHTQGLPHVWLSACTPVILNLPVSNTKSALPAPRTEGEHVSRRGCLRVGSQELGGHIVTVTFLPLLSASAHGLGRTESSVQRAAAGAACVTGSAGSSIRRSRHSPTGGAAPRARSRPALDCPCRQQTRCRA
jgi:hypothetical protein